MPRMSCMDLGRVHNRRVIGLRTPHFGGRFQPFRKFRSPVGGPGSAWGSESPVRDSTRAGRLLAEGTHAVVLVLLEIALEPAHLALGLEGEDVGGDPVQEPPVVRRD